MIFPSLSLHILRPNHLQQNPTWNHFQWISHEFPMNFQWISHEFPMNFQRISHEFPMNFPPGTRSASFATLPPLPPRPPGAKRSAPRAEDPAAPPPAAATTRWPWRNRVAPPERPGRPPGPILVAPDGKWWRKAMLPSGKHRKNDGKSPFWMGKSMN